MRKINYKYLTNNVKQTQKLGEDFAIKMIKKLPLRRATIIGLLGDLGSGKTAFLQGFAKGLGIKERVLSPTFLIIKRFPLNNKRTKNWDNFYHVDCYRIKSFKELKQLGFEDIIWGSRNIIAIEWAGEIRKDIPLDAVINFRFIDKNKREVLFCRKQEK